MGTTLTAIVQTFMPANKYSEDYWYEVCSWEFGKNYELMMWLQQPGRATDGWPRDRGSHEDPDLEYCGDSQGERFWCEPLLLDAALVGLAEEAVHLSESGETDRGSEDWSWITLHLEAMVASLKVLLARGERVRVLFYKM